MVRLHEWMTHKINQIDTDESSPMLRISPGCATRNAVLAARRISASVPDWFPRPEITVPSVGIDFRFEFPEGPVYTVIAFQDGTIGHTVVGFADADGIPPLFVHAFAERLLALRKEGGNHDTTRADASHAGDVQDLERG